jgi:peptidyl-prolyl cis-trans isomerase A (cyclophilin A)
MTKINGLGKDMTDQRLRAMTGQVMALVLGWLCACAAIGQPAPATPAPASGAAAPLASSVPAPSLLVRVALQTSMGTIVLDLDKAHAPLTTANFMKYVDQKRLNGTTFYRSMHMAGDANGLIQGGASGDPKRILPPVKHEPTSLTGLTNRDGAISMARGEPGTANGDFFICIGNMTGLDAHPGEQGDALGYAAFGRVVEGMDVVQRIYAAPISPTKGAGFMRGQMIAAPVKIIMASRVKPGAR